MSPPVDKNRPGPTFSLSKTAAVMLLFLILALGGIWSATSRKRSAGTGDLHREVRLLMDTGVEIVFPAESPVKAKEVSGRTFDEMERLENRLNRNQAESEISTLNRRAGKGPVGVSLDTIDLLEQALFFSDISQGPLILHRLCWTCGASDGNYRVPAEGELKPCCRLWIIPW